MKSLHYDTCMVLPGYSILRIDEQYAGKHTKVICRLLPGKIVNREEGILFPGERGVRLKNILTLPDGNVSFILKGAIRSLIIPGAVILGTEWPVHQHCEALLLTDGPVLPGGEYRLMGGITQGFNKEKLVGRIHGYSDGAFFRIQLPRPYPMIPGMQVSLSDSNDKIRYFRLFYPGSVDRLMMRRFNAEIRRRSNPHPDLGEIYECLLYSRGFQFIPPILNEYPFPGSVKTGKWVVMENEFSGVEKSLMKLTMKPGGAEISSLNLSAYPHDFLVHIADELCRRNKLLRRDGWLFIPGPPPLAPFHRSWLEKIRQTGKKGLRTQSIKSSSDIEAVAVLGRSGLAVGGTFLWFCSEVAEQMCESLLSNFEKGENLVIADVRKKLGGSRTVSLEILKILELSGKLRVRKDGVTRVVM